jgi:undecaprenyl-diphosphatase
MWRSFKAREIKDSDLDAKLGWLLVVSTIPAGIIGLLLKDQIQHLFISPRSAAIFLAANGALLFSAELLRKKAKRSASGEADKRIAGELSWWQSVKIGLLQLLALIPGFSRTGSTMTGGLLVGLSHEDALRYSFLLATPIIAAAAALELPVLVSSGNSTEIGVALAGAAAAAIAAYASVKFLTRYFKTKNLTPFAIYCLAIGVLSFLILNR